jgi:hypothetical protein
MLLAYVSFARPLTLGEVMGLLKVVLAVVVVAGLALIGAGAYQLVKVETGVRTLATVDECHLVSALHGKTPDCTGTWVVGGSLLNGGHVVVGDITGVDSHDVGKKVKVTLVNGEAFTRSPAVPIVVICLGIVLTAAGVLLVKVVRTPQRGRIVGTTATPA